MPPTDEIPLTEATYFILLSLADAPRHGYAILKDVEALSQARIVFSTGTLYGALKRLLDLGWIKRADDAGREPDTGLPRKAYTLTASGVGCLARMWRGSNTTRRSGLAARGPA